MADTLAMNVQLLPKFLSDAYEMFDSLNLSVTALVVIGLVFAAIFLVAAREAASWFFKIDDLKKDIKKVNQLVVDMEAEVRLLQGLLSQNMKLASPEAPTQKKTEPASSVLSTKEEPKTRFNLQH